MKRQKKGSLRRREIRTGYLMIAPLMAGVIVFFIGAFFQNVYYSFTNNVTTQGGPQFKTETLVQYIYKTGFNQPYNLGYAFALSVLLLVVILAVLLAVLLNSKVKGIGAFRVCIFLPAVTLPAAIGLLWKWLMNYKFGIFNEILGKFGVEPVAWLSDSRIVLYSISIVFIWASVAYQVIVLLAGLQGIPVCYREASEIDGANGVQRFFKITLPLLSPSIFFVCVTTVINVFQIFDFIYLMIPQGSSGTEASRSLVTYFFEQSFVKFHKGYGAAISLMLFLLILAITAVQMICQKKLVFYDD